MPDCMASFKRVLTNGLVTSMFDHHAFPHESAEAEKRFEVKNENGKVIHIPRPVHGLRIWDHKQGDYKQVRKHMEGAPKPEEAAKYWADMIKKLKETRGSKLIDDILAGKEVSEQKQ